MNYNRYSPQPLLLPPNSELTRRFINKHSHLPGKPLLSEKDYEGFETHTVFNDIYITPDGKNLQAIGPPLANLSEHLLPLQLRVRHGDHSLELKHRHRRHKRLSLHYFSLPQELHQCDSITVTMRLATEQEKTFTLKRFVLPAVTLQFVTLQKNNPIEWILDWLAYCHSLGVQRVLLYDNSSDNVEQLDTALQSSKSIPDTVLIDWRFPYGPGNSYYNRFCQSTQNNHAYRCFGQAEWTGHFDVDEYLTIRDGGSLMKKLNDASWRDGLLRFDSFWVPDVEGVLGKCENNRIPTIRDFNYRDRQSRGKAHKYIARHRCLRVANTHNAKVKFGFRRKAVDVNEAAFLHYKCLTDDWRGFEKRVGSEDLDKHKHVEDKSVQQQLVSYDQSCDDNKHG